MEIIVFDYNSATDCPIFRGTLYEDAKSDIMTVECEIFKNWKYKMAHDHKIVTSPHFS